ncbi:MULTISPECIES: hypothetical protein [unclassified Mycobacterium]|uniref:hypothetical protein n=1 Tax=unclassified Mycobacterium TaxID=2642494 RepID=UPI0029C6DDF1|nr:MULTISPECIES: hypothetical protein [unclassified Mycobacterium]
MTVISRYGDVDATLDVRLADYNTRHGLPGRWTDRVLARLAGPHSLSGRHVLRAQLERLGLPSRQKKDESGSVEPLTASSPSTRAL